MKIDGVSVSDWFLRLHLPDDESQVEERVKDGDDGCAGLEGKTEAARVVWLVDRAVSESVSARSRLLHSPGALTNLLSPRHLRRSPLVFLSISEPGRVREVRTMSAMFSLVRC